MSVWSRFTDLFRRSTTALNPSQWFVDWIRDGAGSDVSGITVTTETSMRLAAVWACVRVRSEDVGKLPCFLYERTADNGKRRATEHPLFNLVRYQPNPRMTALEFRQLMQVHIDLQGNAYALKEYDERGQVVALWPIDPHRVVIMRSADGTEMFYRVMLYGQTTATIYPAEAIFHVRGMSLDGMVGLSPIAYHRETVGLAMAAQRYGAAFFGNSAQPGGALKFPGVVSPEAAKALRADWEAKYRGPDNARKLAIFDGGMEWIQTAMDNTDAQYIEARSFQNREIWRIYRVPAHKVGDLDKATFSNIEQQALEYVTDCLMTELTRWEQALWLQLLSTADQQRYYFEFLVDALLRGDLKSRYEAYAIGRNWGWLSVNDVREKENMNRVPNGDIRLQPLNMVEAGKPPPQPSPNPPAPAGEKPTTEPPKTTEPPPPSAPKQIEDDTLIERTALLPAPEPEPRHLNGTGS